MVKVFNQLYSRSCPYLFLSTPSQSATSLSSSMNKRFFSTRPYTLHRCTYLAIFILAGMAKSSVNKPPSHANQPSISITSKKSLVISLIYCTFFTSFLLSTSWVADSGSWLFPSQRETPFPSSSASLFFLLIEILMTMRAIWPKQFYCLFDCHWREENKKDLASSLFSSYL